MLSLEQEVESIRPTLGDRRADALIARERRDVFSLYPEVRICAWAGAMLLAAAAGILLKKHFDAIGPVALATAVGIAAAACYAWVWWRRGRATVADDYVLLLGALLVSADLAFIEQQFRLLEHHWPRHFLLLAVAHGVAAYAYRSRLVLSLSIAALAAWMGIERRNVDMLFTQPVDVALRAFATSALVIVWWALHRRARLAPEFLRVFEHFAANLALLGGLLLMNDRATFEGGCILTIILAAAVIAWSFRQKSEPFVLYAFVYGVIAADTLLLEQIDQNETAVFITLIVSMIAAVAGLVALHRRFQGAGA